MRPAMALSANRSDCSGRKAPALSHRCTTGSRFSMAMSRARIIFLTVSGYQAPPFTEGSLQLMTTSRPPTTPMPVMQLADGEPPS